MELIVDFPHIIEGCSAHHHDNRFPQVEKKRVSFSEKVKAWTIENLSFEHKADLWFTDREILRFRQQTIVLLKSLQARGMTVAQYAAKNTEDTSVFLGLESHLTGTTARHIRDRRKRLARAVMSEQSRQIRRRLLLAAGGGGGSIEYYYYDPIERLASISAAETECSRVRAHIVGLLHCDKRSIMGRPDDDVIETFTSASW